MHHDWIFPMFYSGENKAIDADGQFVKMAGIETGKGCLHLRKYVFTVICRCTSGYFYMRYLVNLPTSFRVA